jgi:hypothetical protein
MKNGDLSGATATAPPVAANGAHPPPGPKKEAKKAAQKGSARSSARNGVSYAPQPLAGFVEIEHKPADAPMWLLHPVSWLQAERAPLAPAWTGLAIERHNRISRPDFLPLESAPPNRSNALDNSCDALAPNPHCELPRSDLAPLGWDPRAVCRKENNQ